MNSLLPSALSSFDKALVQYGEDLAALEAALAVEVADVVEHVKKAAESAENLRQWIAAEMPQASWKDRDELELILQEIVQKLEARRIEELRTQLFDLAAELERGSIVHRRAVRVTEVNELRQQAIDELMEQSAADAPPKFLPGPEATKWVEWACGLKEPDDTEALRSLRSGFPRLDDFVANLEPGMWMVEPGAVTAAERRQQELRMMQERSYRLLALSDELERGRVVHHRAFRVNQLTQLRDQAVAELRSKAEAEVPPELPGPDSAQWVEWACSLQEPDDAESLQMIRSEFASLDDFVANLEADMWITGGAGSAEAADADKTDDEPPQQPPVATTRTVSPAASSSPDAALAVQAVMVAPEPEPAVAVAATQPVPVRETVPDVVLTRRQETAEAREDEKPTRASRTKGLAAVQEQIKRAVVSEREAASEEEEDVSFISRLKAKVETQLKGRWPIVGGGAALVLLVLAALLIWHFHRGGDSGQVRAAERSEATRTTQPTSTDAAAVVTPAAAAPNASAKQTADKQTKTKDESTSAKQQQQQTTDAPEPQANLLDNGGVRTPTAIPKNAKKEDTLASNAEAPNLPGVLGSSGAASSVMNVVKELPVAQPKIAPQKVKVSSGVAQGMLVHRVTPEYPSQARQQGIQGTVVLQAVIGKDGAVKNVRALSGNSLLRQAAIDAVKQWKYKPYSLNGEPVEADTQIDVKFKPTD